LLSRAHGLQQHVSDVKREDVPLPMDASSETVPDAPQEPEAAEKTQEEKVADALGASALQAVKQAQACAAVCASGATHELPQPELEARSRRP